MSRYRQLLNSCCNKGAALLGLLLVSACTDAGVPANTSASLCHADSTPISTIQGDDYYSPLKGKQVTIHGVVTWVSRARGIYVEDATSPRLDSHSRALFVSDESLTGSAAPGQLVAIRGQVAELGSSRDKMTSLTDISDIEICSEKSSLPLTDASLPMNSRTREALEGMRVSFGQAMTVTDVFKLSDGELTVSGRGVLRIPTEVVKPGRAAVKREAENRNLALVVSLPAANHTPFPVGSILNELHGLMGHNGRGQQLFLQKQPGIESPGADRLESARD